MNAWNFVKGYTEYLYLAVCAGLAVWSFADGDAVGGWVCLGVGLVMVPPLRWLRNWKPPQRPVPVPVRRELTWEQGEMEALRRVGTEPVPIPGEVHDPGNCEFCVVIESDFNKGDR